MVERKLGLLAFANRGGLGAQTRRLAHMLKPERIMVINSSGFSPNKEQHFEWYKDFNFFVTNGFPNDDDVKAFLQNLTHVFSCENPYNFNLVYYAQKQGTKVYCQTNYEFCENLSKPYLPVVDKFLMPSYWMIDDMEKRFGKDRVEYLPPPMSPDEFKDARKINMDRKSDKRKLLHIIGTLVSEDRNGTLDLLEAVKKSKDDFELTIHTQHPLPMSYFLDDKRVVYRIEDFRNNEDLYKGFDALILPRRFGGLSLTTNEALMSGMPVVMTDISPNNQLLPHKWLVKSRKKGSFIGRSEIPLYSANHVRLAEKIGWLVNMKQEELDELKKQAFKLGVDNFSEKSLIEDYKNLFKSS